MGIGRIIGVTSIALASAAGMGVIGANWDEIAGYFARKPAIEGVRKPLSGDAAPATRTSTVALTPDDQPDSAAPRLGAGGAPVTVAAVGPIPNMVRMRPTAGQPQLADALKEGEFVPYYQPIVDIRSGRLRGAEVLARWRKPDGSLVLPGQFIPLAESSGLIRQLTIQLMKRAATEMGSALGRRPALKISFNFAAGLFADETIVKDVRKIFINTPIDFPQVVLELTEREPIENFALAAILPAHQRFSLAHRHDQIGMFVLMQRMMALAGQLNTPDPDVLVLEQNLGSDRDQGLAGF